jgi:hypothetical protein|tara:strand:+ start:212 stop:826 length:615 start_codon:yes stop_codon:yes gene_type:complete
VSKIRIPQLTPAEESDLIDPVSVMPEVEANIPMPKSKKEAIPEMTSERELKIRSTTIKELADINGEDITPSKEHQEQAQELAREMMTNKKLKPEFSDYPNETMAFLAGIVGQTNSMIVEELADLKLFVVNNFVQLAAMAKNDRDKLAALRAIGEIDGVDAFKRKTEITHITKSGDELEKELRETIEQLKGTIIEGEHEIIEKDD